MIIEKTTSQENTPKQRERLALDMFFKPKSVALIGATERAGSVGCSLASNMLSAGFEGSIYPINPKHPQIFGRKAYARIEDVPASIDMAVIATPAATVPDVVADCARAGVAGVIILSAGFKEIGAEGAALEQRILKEAESFGMRVIGPNCLGLMNPHAHLNATFASYMATPGNLAFISQSGALCTATLDWSRKQQVGFSAFVSIGSMIDVGWGDLIDHLGNDPQTRSILIYMESIGDVRSFMSAAREVALAKPIVVLKAGRTSEAAKAATSHTGALAGSDEAIDAAFRRCGVLRVNTIAELFYMAEALVKQPRPRGSRLTVVTNAGGPGVLAADAIIGCGGELAHLSDETMDSLNSLLPPQWSHNNPIDVLGDANPARYAEAVKIAAADPNSDGLLVVLTPQAMTDPTETAQHIVQVASDCGKPILASWMGGFDTAKGDEILCDSGIATFPYPDTAARIFRYMAQYSDNLRSLYATPMLLADPGDGLPERETASHIMKAALKAGRTLLTEPEAKRVVEAYGIPTVKTVMSENEDDAVAVADKMGYPVVLKLYSETITHKTDAGGIQLNLQDARDVRRAYQAIEKSVREKAGDGHFQGVTVQPMVRHSGYELILGSSIDSQMGPVLLFGAGGQLVEVFKDHALGLPPLNTVLALQIMQQTKIFNALRGVRGRAPVDIPALAALIVRFSQLVAENPGIKEIDINPLVASPELITVLDARIVLHEEGADVPRVAIRPYPTQYIWEQHLKDGTPIRLRPICPEDEPLMVQFHETLSPESVHFRYFSLPGLQQRVAHERLTRMCFIDYDRQIALVADRQNPHTKCHEIVGVGRLIRSRKPDRAEFAMIVSDSYQGRGLGTLLIERLLDVARAEKIKKLVADILPENYGMQRLCERHGFHLHLNTHDGVVNAEINL
jgi:acetyltransferase